jgi:hypothetical protein
MFLIRNAGCRSVEIARLPHVEIRDSLSEPGWRQLRPPEDRKREPVFGSNLITLSTPPGSYNATT